MRRINRHGGAVHAPPDLPAPERIGALTDLPIGELRHAWSEVWGAPPPKGARRRLLMLGIAWKWQAAIHNGLPKPLERACTAPLRPSILRINPPEPGDRPCADRCLRGVRHSRAAGAG